MGTKVLVLAAALLAALPGAAWAQGKYIHANNSNYDTLDPHAVFDVGRAAVRINFYDGLYRWVDNPPKQIPWLAESHEITGDGHVWTFKLRSDVKFHDGTPMTADDVVYSMERILAVKRGVGGLLAPMVAPGNTKALDAHTVQFKLTEPSVIFGALVSDIAVVNSKLVKRNEKNGDWGQAWLAKNEAGTGSFKLKRYDPAVGFIGERFKDHFYGWGPKYFDEIEFRTVLETNTRLLGLIKGDYHGLDGYLTPDAIDRLKAAPGVQVIEEESMRVFQVSFNNERAPLDDVNLRKALSYAFDYDAIINDIMKGTVVRNPTIVPNNMWGAPKDVKGYTYDLEKAKEYLAKVKQPIRPLIMGTLAGFSDTEQVAAILQNGARKIGVEIKLESAPWGVISSRTQNSEQMYDIVGYPKSTYYANPNNWLGEAFGSRYIPTRNVARYRNPEVDKRIERALVSNDQAERVRLNEEAGRIVFEDAPGMWIYNTKWFGPYSTKVAGIRFSPIGNGQEMRWAYFK